MHPDHLHIPLPARGFVSVESDSLGDACDGSTTKWIKGRSGSLNLFVSVDGPHGSARLWDITVGIATANRSKPTRGVCLSTSTVGWRTLQRYKDAPLPWLADIDNDGADELVLWNSFPLHEDATLAEYGLMAWVYRVVSKDSLVLDWSLSRTMARNIAEAYRSPLDSAGYPNQLRAVVADVLERFEDERCGE